MADESSFNALQKRLNKIQVGTSVSYTFTLIGEVRGIQDLLRSLAKSKVIIEPNDPNFNILEPKDLAGGKRVTFTRTK